jgi:hypothetical protein
MFYSKAQVIQRVVFLEVSLDDVILDMFESKDNGGAKIFLLFKKTSKGFSATPILFSQTRL